MKMRTKVYYIDNTNEANDTINYVIDNYICFVTTKTVEMNYLEVTITCRVEDLLAIKNCLKDYV